MKMRVVLDRTNFRRGKHTSRYWNKYYKKYDNSPERIFNNYVGDKDELYLEDCDVEVHVVYSPDLKDRYSVSRLLWKVYSGYEPADDDNYALCYWHPDVISRIEFFDYIYDIIAWEEYEYDDLSEADQEHTTDYDTYFINEKKEDIENIYDGIEDNEDIIEIFKKHGKICVAKLVLYYEKIEEEEE
jgi:hypothetical protein